MGRTAELILQRLDRIEQAVTALAGCRPRQDWYTVAEFAAAVKRARFTVRQWCLRGRIRARKRPCGRGATREWSIAHEELLRFQKDGLLPQDRYQSPLRHLRD